MGISVVGNGVISKVGLNVGSRVGLIAKYHKDKTRHSQGLETKPSCKECLIDDAKRLLTGLNSRVDSLNKRQGIEKHKM